ncbi:GNAT family N-acetyltransferase [Ponticaulis koreensis]|uniref:GNAT family N-acetyltransferase n=1 Tax=Ponticaulis koreensis TaxID=1123045 RepID=UPI0003B6AA13|nr:GNAT family N-acetyltransferase [Ponticaulis koreensis]
MQKILKTKRLTLRPLAAVDTAWLLGFWNISDVNRMTGSIPAKVDEDFVRGRIQAAAEGDEAQTSIVRMIELEDGTRTGVVSLDRTTTQEPFNLGYAIHPDFWGQGIATEAGQAILDWADGFVTPKYYVSGHFTDNPASGNVLKKLGFMPCWRAPVYSTARDEKADHLYMSRLI